MTRRNQLLISISVLLAVGVYKYYFHTQPDTYRSISSTQLKHVIGINNTIQKSIQKFPNKTINSKALVLITADLSPNTRRKVASEVILSDKEHMQVKTPNFSYKLVENMRAIENTKENREDFPDYSLQNNYLIVDTGLNIGVQVMRNIQTGGFGIVTGILKVKYTGDELDVSLFDTYNPEVYKEFKHLKVIHIKFENLETLIFAQGEASKHSFIKRAKIEILEFDRQER